jgi:hypothetical protein
MEYRRNPSLLASAVVTELSVKVTSLRIDGSHLVAELAIDLDALNLVQVCEQCRQPMAGERSTKRFCSATCRKAAYRLKGGAG